MTEDHSLPMYVVYHNPSDYPGEYVIRRQVVKPHGVLDKDPVPLAHGMNYTEVLNHLPKGVFRLPRDSRDDPVILEVWI